jgi:ABC-type multidrug transport system ATPase subunit
MTVAVSNLGKRFNREWIFRGLTMEFTAGNIYAITGPNGSGKSTLMQVLWGQVPPSEGKLEFTTEAGTIPIEEAFNQLTLAAPYMDLLEEFTLREHLNFHFQLKQMTAGDSIDGLLHKLELEIAADKPIKQFSSGMKQRVKLGLALFSQSKAVFLDEPTTNLDEAAAAWYRNHLARIAPEKLVFIATNQPSDYPVGTTLLNLANLKKGYNTA